jgi:hypothetical protein
MDPFFLAVSGAMGRLDGMRNSMTGRPKRRPPKKTAMLEVRVAPEDKADFVETCRRNGHSASAVIRKAMRTHVRRIQERPGRLRMMMTMAVMLPFVGMLETSQPENAGVSDLIASGPVCTGRVVRTAPVWPVGSDGEDLTVPGSGVRVLVRYDGSETGLAENIRAEAPEGYDAFATAAVAAMRNWCLPEEEAGSGNAHAFDFKLTPDEG